MDVREGETGSEGIPWEEISDKKKPASLSLYSRVELELSTSVRALARL